MRCHISGSVSSVTIDVTTQWSTARRRSCHGGQLQECRTCYTVLYTSSNSTRSICCRLTVYIPQDLDTAKIVAQAPLHWFIQVVQQVHNKSTAITTGSTATARSNQCTANWLMAQAVRRCATDDSLRSEICVRLCLCVFVWGTTVCCAKTANLIEMLVLVRAQGTLY